MATTTNYSWSTPDNTAYVKDGASSIRTLGSSVDTTLFTALGGAYPGLRLVKKQVIGTGVSSATVTGAFSAIYDNYKIIVTGGTASTTVGNLTFSLGGITSGYYSNLAYLSWTSGSLTAIRSGSTSQLDYAGGFTSTGLSMDLDLRNPFTTTRKWGGSIYAQVNATYNAGPANHFIDSTTSATAFTITPAGATMTGGTIYVYGYGMS
jgi:hypothetical protein